MPGFAYQCGVLVASSVVYIEAVFAKTMSYATAMALTAVTVFALAAIVAAAGKERKGHAFRDRRMRLLVGGRPTLCSGIPAVGAARTIRQDGRSRRCAPAPNVVERHFARARQIRASQIRR